MIEALELLKLLSTLIPAPDGNNDGTPAELHNLTYVDGNLEINIIYHNTWYTLTFTPQELTPPHKILADVLIWMGAHGMELRHEKRA